MDNTTDQYVFVYGTLRRGCSNHELISQAVFAGGARTLQPFSLYVGLYPYVVKAQPQVPIRGEVYRVDPGTLERLDELEDHPKVYCREQVEVELDGGRRLMAWIYFYPQPEGTPAPSGDYADWPESGAI